jgi:hypothetical protein
LDLLTLSFIQFIFWNSNEEKNGLKMACNPGSRNWGGGLKETGGGDEFNYDIFDIL